jgi:hypothetical protein
MFLDIAITDLGIILPMNFDIFESLWAFVLLCKDRKVYEIKNNIYLVFNIVHRQLIQM